MFLGKDLHLSKTIRLFSLGLALVFVFRLGAEGSSLDLIADQVLSQEEEQEFFRADRAYLNSSREREEILQEINQLEVELASLRYDYRTTSKGIKIYTANTGLKNNMLRTALRNRQAFLEEEDFVYNSQPRYTMDRGQEEERPSRGYFSQEDLDLSLEALEDLLDNIDLDLDFLATTNFVICPYILEGINGYAVSRTRGGNTIVLANQASNLDRAQKKEAVKATSLHEIGHIFQNSDRTRESDLARDYFLEKDRELSSYREGASNKSDSWKAASGENFAEDFRLYFSQRLGEESFRPADKKTVLNYREHDFDKLILALK